MQAPRQNLTPEDWQDLNAWLDGELDNARNQEIQQKVRNCPTWARAFRELQRVDEIVEEWQAPAPSPSLESRIIYATRRRAGILKVVRYFVPLAAAAAVVIVALLSYVAYTFTPGQSREPASLVTQAPDSPRVDDSFIVENLDFISTYDVVINFETLQAIEKIEEVLGT